MLLIKKLLCICKRVHICFKCGSKRMQCKYRQSPACVTLKCAPLLKVKYLDSDILERCLLECLELSDDELLEDLFNNRN